MNITLSSKFEKEKTIVKVGNVEIGSNKVVLIAGPCAIESKELLFNVVPLLKDSGVSIIRGGAFKIRTSPFSFQGLQDEGLNILNEIRSKFNIPVVSEIENVEDIPLFEQNVDMIQVGTRNMQNVSLLKALGKTKMPILLKRGFGNTVEELLLASEYILKEGNPNVVLCERGIRTFENSTRFTLDISAIPVIKKNSHLPIIVDPSHAAGDYEYVESLSKAAVAAGADGLIIEVHPEPDKALSDGEQSLKIKRLTQLIEELDKIVKAIGRELWLLMENNCLKK